MYTHRTLICFVKKETLKQSINAQHFYESSNLLSTKAFTFFEFISHINHFFYNIYTVIQRTTSLLLIRRL